VISISSEHYIVDNTGAIIDVISENQNYAILEQGDRVTRKSSIKHLSDTVKINCGFVKVNDIVIGTFDKELLYCCKLFEYVSYMDGRLTWGNGRYIKNATDFARICNISTTTSKKLLKRLLDEDIIHKHKKEKDERSFFYTFNPYICLRGSKASKNLYEEFKDTKYRFMNGE
jgi:hypothetical protein